MVLSTFIDKYLPKRGTDFVSRLRSSLKRELSKISEVWEDDEDDKSSEKEDQTESNFQIDPSNLLVKDFTQLKKLRHRKIEAMVKVICCIIGVTLLSWFIGATGSSWAWILLGLLLAGTIIRTNLHSIVEQDIRFQKIRLHNKRALETDETCEWLNVFLNRWWVFSSTSIFTFGKKIVDPLLQESKPSFVEAVSLKEMTLGDRTPLLRSIRCWDAQGVGGQEQSAFKTGCSLHTPPGLALAPTHALAVLCDFTLDSDTFSAVLGARVGHKGMGVDLDIVVEHLVLEGRVLFTLYFDMEAPFPHLARASFSFVEQPRVSFRIKMLKTVQMMEMPILKTWIYNLVTEALATAFVDPSQLEFSINSNETFISDHRHRQALAKGVLTISLRLHRNTCSAQLDEDKWIVAVVGGSTHISPCFKSMSWEDSSSFLLFQTIASSTVSIKVKSKRLITTTLAQFDLPLYPYNLDTCRMAETILQKKGAKVIGGGVPPLCVKMEYHPLAPVSLEDAQENKEDSCEAGVLYIIIHGADNLTSCGNKPSPYCLLFNKRKKITATHFERGTLSPRWESEAEILVTNLSSVCLTLLVCSKNSKQQDGDLLGINTLNLSSVTLPLVRKKLPLNRNSSSPCPEELPSSNSTLTISVVFRSVPALASSTPSTMGSCHSKGMQVPISLSTSSIASDLSPVSNTISSASAQTPTFRSYIVDEDGQQKVKKKSNPKWLSQAKILLSSHGDGVYAGSQDLEGIFATGLGLIELTIIRARELVSKDLNGFSDPYCVLKVNGEVKYRTQVKKKTLDPEWNENLMTHLPLPGQNLMLTLWDHDAFGMKDFLGSVSLTEEQIRNLSATNSPDWFKLEGAKSGCIEIKIKLISENQEFYNRTDMMTRSSENNDTLSDDSSKSGSDNSSHEKEDTPGRENNPSGVLIPTVRNTSPYIRRKQMMFEDKPNILKSSSISVFPSWEESCKTEPKTVTPSVESLCTPTRQRKSGAEIISSAIEDAKTSSTSSDFGAKSCHDDSEEMSNTEESRYLKLKKEINKLKPMSKSENKLDIVDYSSQEDTALINISDNPEDKSDNSSKESKFKDWKKRHHYSQLKMKITKDKDKHKDTKHLDGRK